MKKGFTLIELLVVITILAVLAGAALPYVQNYVEESRIAKAKTDLEEVARALAVYETREGDYAKTDVSDLTGRYLNKSPIDPWGAPYVVDVNGGIVYSTGPDRKDTDPDDKLDNISVAYQPPLALVSVKWVDKNQSGKVDFQNVADELHLLFSRRLGTTSPLELAGFTGKIDLTTLSTGLLSDIVNSAAPKLVGGKTVVYPINANDAFVAGRDSLKVQDSHNAIYDVATPDRNYCISSQDVKILPQ